LTNRCFVAAGQERIAAAQVLALLGLEALCMYLLLTMKS